MSIGLCEEHETVIDRVLRKVFLTRNKISVRSALKVANLELAGQGLNTISEDVLNNRIKIMQDRLVERKRNGGQAARQKNLKYTRKKLCAGPTCCRSNRPCLAEYYGSRSNDTALYWSAISNCTF